ncbi:hypothetical protein OGR47_20470 (plasmid) [Methylocystis sp. MJC1]|uniref:hypothetical protein n=1 Tax=Methylocystis sp. MJC1 TaxID=2654282 RepID=UPI0013EAFAB3|nr:hypothetical protein [Methylocystis sp. MJC1]MBU6529277.1 hypothetical protein [Methylocystis sp. MJC1]UZX13948.1 hypothetical protein OGR47_20470 [Methylocystis sp. MJC1]
MDVDRRVIAQFDVPLAGDFIHFVEADPGKSDRGRGVFDIESRLHRAEGDFPAAVGADDDRRWPAQVR